MGKLQLRVHLNSVQVVLKSILRASWCPLVSASSCQRVAFWEHVGLKLRDEQSRAMDLTHLQDTSAPVYTTV